MVVKSVPVHLSIVHISFVRAGNSVVVGEERGVGGGIGPSSDSVITRTDYYLTVAGLRAQWRRPARSVTRVSPEKLLGHVRGNDLRAGARGFSWRYYIYTRIHTREARVIQMQISIGTEGIRRRHVDRVS